MARFENPHAPVFDAQAIAGEEPDRLGVNDALLLADTFGERLRRVGFEPDSKPYTTAEPPPVQSSNGKIMLAVLPFKDMSPDPQEWFSDGMTDEMIAQLGGLHPQRLGVIARTSAMQYKNTTMGIDRVSDPDQ